MRTVKTDAAPAAIGPYSQAKITGGLMFASGQIPVNPASGKIEAADIEGQTEQVCKNIQALLEGRRLFHGQGCKDRMFPC